MQKKNPFHFVPKVTMDALLLAVLLHSRAFTVASSSTPPNILLFVFDDLRPALSPYKSPGAVTPNIQKLADAPGATTFLNAYVQQAVCGPSRVSFLTGRRPDSTKVRTFLSAAALIACMQQVQYLYSRTE